MKSTDTSRSATALSESELAELDELLEAAEPDNAMMLEEFDGLCAALACAPSSPRKDSAADEPWLALAVGGNLAQARRRLDQAQFDRLRTLLNQHRQSVAQRLTDTTHFSAVIGHDQDGRALADAWAIGFLRGVELNEEVWAEVQDDERYEEIFELIYRFAMDGADPDSSAAAGDIDTTLAAAPIADDEREALVDDMLDGVSELFDALAPVRQGARL
jgi:yecA family protein